MKREETRSDALILVDLERSLWSIFAQNEDLEPSFFSPSLPIGFVVFHCPPSPLVFVSVCVFSARLFPGHVSESGPSQSSRSVSASSEPLCQTSSAHSLHLPSCPLLIFTLLCYSVT